MPQDIREEAERLANQNYHAVITIDETVDGQLTYFGYYLELPDCIAQGDSPQEVRQELKEVAVEFIETYLESGISVPQPYAIAHTSATGGNSANHITVNISYRGIDGQQFQDAGVYNSESDELPILRENSTFYIFTQGG